MKKAIAVLVVLVLAVAAYAVAEEAASNSAAPAAAGSTAAVPAPEAPQPAAPDLESTASAAPAGEGEEAGEGEPFVVPGIPAAPLPADSPLKTMTDKVSYAIGQDIGGGLKKQSIDVNMEFLTKGIQDAVSGATPLMDQRQIEETLVAFQKEYAATQAAKQKETADKNLKEGEAFLAEGAKKPGVVTLPDGLQYEVLTDGNGEKPKGSDTVTVNYRGTFIDGKEFDSSYGVEPASFRVEEVSVPAWAEALQLMKVGSKWRILVPAKLGYGEQGYAGVIPPNAALIFEIELLSIEKPASEIPQVLSSDVTAPSESTDTK